MAKDIRKLFSSLRMIKLITSESSLFFPTPPRAQHSVGKGFSTIDLSLRLISPSRNKRTIQGPSHTGLALPGCFASGCKADRKSFESERVAIRGVSSGKLFVRSKLLALRSRPPPSRFFCKEARSEIL